jgi:hypothetical protein
MPDLCSVRYGDAASVLTAVLHLEQPAGYLIVDVPARRGENAHDSAHRKESSQVSAACEGNCVILHRIPAHTNEKRIDVLRGSGNGVSPY